MRPPELERELARRGAVLDAAGGEPARAAHFGDPTAEARAAFESGVVREQPARARLAVRGPDRREFVNRMCTNDVRRVTPDAGIAAALTNAKGRLLDLVRVAERGEELLLLGSDSQGPALRAWLEKHVVMEELEIAEFAGRESSLLAFGPGAEEAVRAVAGTAPAPVDGGFGVARGRFEGADLLLLGSGPAPLEGIELLAPPAVAGALFGRLADAGLAPIGEEAWRQVRIEAGIPAHGREIHDNANPLEAGLRGAVSFEKGCYIGQEVVARLNSYAKVQRHLVGVKFPAGVDPAAVHEIFWDLLRVGNASSATASPRLGATVALAFVKTDYASPGTAVYTVRSGERFDGAIVPLPFA